jgi:hypothetical protein
MISVISNLDSDRLSDPETIIHVFLGSETNSAATPELNSAATGEGSR